MSDWEDNVRGVSFAIDFDGTITKDGFPEVGEVREGAFEVLLEMQKAGHKLILWTCRYNKYLADAIIMCKANGLLFDKVCDNLMQTRSNYGDPRKIVATHYVDDRNAPFGFPGWAKFHDWLVENNYL